MAVSIPSQSPRALLYETLLVVKRLRVCCFLRQFIRHGIGEIIFPVSYTNPPRLGRAVVCLVELKG